MKMLLLFASATAIAGTASESNTNTNTGIGTVGPFADHDTAAVWANDNTSDDTQFVIVDHYDPNDVTVEVEAEQAPAGQAL